MTQLLLNELNSIAPEEFVAALEGVFEHAPWVAEAAAKQRPFPGVTELHAAMLQAVDAAPPDRQLKFLRGHPALAAQTLASAGLTAESRAEQHGLQLGSLGNRVEAFETASSAYAARFGFPFIVCVRRQTPPFVLRNLERRLTNTPQQEVAAAMAEIAHITRLRLVDRVTGPGMPKTTGQLSAHVLDTARGRAASGIKIEVLREDVLINQAVTNVDGRTDTPLLADGPLRIGRYELRFHVAAFYEGLPSISDPPLYDVIPVRIGVAEPEAHYHIPLLLGAWSYTTYRGS